MRIKRRYLWGKRKEVYCRKKDDIVFALFSFGAFYLFYLSLAKEKIPKTRPSFYLLRAETLGRWKREEEKVSKALAAREE